MGKFGDNMKDREFLDTWGDFSILQCLDDSELDAKINDWYETCRAFDELYDQLPEDRQSYYADNELPLVSGPLDVALRWLGEGHKDNVLVYLEAASLALKDTVDKIQAELEE